MLQVTPVPAYADNYIWLIHLPSQSRHVVVVDPGDAQPVISALAEHELVPAGVLLTHRHADHVGGVGELLALADVPVFAPAGEVTPGRSHKVREGDRVSFEGGLTFQVLDVPGHTVGHIAYFGHGALFCGDTLFSAGCGRVFEGTPEQMVSSLAKLAALPEETLVYCGHEYTLSNLAFARMVEPENVSCVEYLEMCRARRAQGQATVPSTIRRERNVNPFLRCDRQSVKQAAEQKVGGRLQNHVEVFAVIRAWKDGFRV